MDRRQFGISALGAVATLSTAKALTFTGPKLADPKDYEAADDIITRLPQHDYVAIMLAIMNLKKPLGISEAKPFNQRWETYGNPLIVRFWQQTGPHPNLVSDCDPWCATFLSWCLKRDGRTMPKDPARSQSFMEYGQSVTAPMAGDICVFTDVCNLDKGHVAVFKNYEGPDHIRVLGGNQGGLGRTECAKHLPQTLVTESVEPLHPNPKKGGMFLNGFRRPPAPISKNVR